jgi:DNA-binding transcriptional ArsR family regulator
MKTLSFFQMVFQLDRPKDLILILSALHDHKLAGYVSRSELIHVLGDMHPSNISRGCNLLAENGFIEVRRVAGRVAYRVADKAALIMELAA